MSLERYEVSYKMEVLSHLMQSAYIMSSDPEGSYYIWCDYSGHVDSIAIRISSRESDDWIFNERAWLDSEDWEKQLRTLVKAVRECIEDDLK